MNNQEVRAHLRMGEQAVNMLSALGYRYGTDPVNANRKVWIAPVNPQDSLKDALEALIKTGIEEGIKKAKPAEPECDRYGPRWGTVRGLVGRNFKILAEKIPEGHKLAGYSHGPHFFGKLFLTEDIVYRQGVEGFTGYVVVFRFLTRPHTPEVVWLPLSACAFQ